MTAKENSDLLNCCKVFVYQSTQIHPDWELEDHMAFLLQEVNVVTPETLFTIVSWPEGPKQYKLIEFVKNWLKNPERLEDEVRKLVCRTCCY